jgi:glycosyltransferase involved in cell wall biosynthesis
MAGLSLSIVIPVRDEALHLPQTLEALVEAVRRSPFEAEVVLVDDRSGDDSPSVARGALADRLPFRVLTQPGEGRFKARRLGVNAARHPWVLLLDARIRLAPESLRFVGEHLRDGAAVWNGHVDVDTRGNPYGAFGNVLVQVAWARYFRQPRRTSYGLDEFDHFPKGTSCFLAPRDVLVSAIESFSPRVADWRLVSDDTQLIRSIAARHRINLSPEFRCDYQPRTHLSGFLRNALYRGSTFVDGHGRRESRFFPVVVVFFPLSAALAAVVLRRPTVLPIIVGATAGAAAATAARARRPAFEIVSFAALAPVYSVGHAAGMWRGLALLVQSRLRAARAA